jgi:Amt family ammonium transporter
MGVVLFLVGWIGFNGGSALSLNSSVPGIVANTLLSAAAGGAMAYLLTQLYHYTEIDPVSSSLNGIIAGLVAITAGCHAVASWQALTIGAIAAVVMLMTSVVLARCRIDDAIGAIPVHLAAGIWGTLAVALFADLEILATGLTRLQQLEVQFICTAAAAVWSFPVLLKNNQEPARTRSRASPISS